MAYIRYPDQAFGMTADTVREQLPQVGDKLYKVMETGRSFGLGNVAKSKCRVVYVNADHLWYMVEFPCGIRQGYKLP